MEEVNVKVEEGVKELVIRKGDAKEIKANEKVVISGGINSCVEYHNKRKKGITNTESHVLVNEEEGTIKLIINEARQFEGTTVEAKLEKTSIMKELGINQEKYFTHDQLLRVIKSKKFYFKDKQEHMNLVTKLNSFKADITGSVLDHKDGSKGERKLALERKAETNLPKDFVIEIPVFKGLDAVSFGVNIGVDPVDSGPRFWLESEGLYELEEKLRAEELQKQIDVLNVEYVVIYQ